jgi:hypothetical protein
MDGAAHPTVVNLDTVDDQIAITERHFVIILSIIVINGFIAILKIQLCFLKERLP